jgi:hypothetical protein
MGQLKLFLAFLDKIPVGKHRLRSQCQPVCNWPWLSLTNCRLVTLTSLRRTDTYHAVPLPCRAANGLDCVFPIWFTMWPCLIHTYHAVPLPCYEYAILKATSHGHGRVTAWYVWNSISRPETAYRRPARVRHWRSNGRVVTGSRHGMCELTPYAAS